MNGVLAQLRLDDVLRQARLQRASDVHLVPQIPATMRIDGQLRAHSTAVVPAEDIEEILSLCFNERARSRLRSNGDASMTYRDAEAGIARIHAYRISGGHALAIRMLAETIPTLEELGLPGVVATFVEKRHGLLIFSGPTGSGKSTALAAFVGRINRTDAKHIVTIEDPIEYRHQSDKSIVSQREVGADVASFNDALMGALRSDPDVILLGEMRDRATIASALTAAETGHLVLATLHTGNAPEAIDRIVGAFAGQMQDQVRMQLAQSLAGVICLRLVARRSAQGRSSAAEVLVANDAVRSVIREAKVHQLRNIIATGRPAGMQTLESALNERLVHNEITYEEALRAANLPAEIRSVQVA